ncbi:MAG: hypothetical protein ABI039_04560, partial [Vicinamibacterales bacterium]
MDKRRSPVLAFIIGVAATALVAMLVGWLLFFRSGLHVNLSQPALVQRIERLQRLETVVYTMEKIVTG